MPASGLVYSSLPSISLDRVSSLSAVLWHYPRSRNTNCLINKVRCWLKGHYIILSSFNDYSLEPKEALKDPGETEDSTRALIKCILFKHFLVT